MATNCSPSSTATPAHPALKPRPDALVLKALRTKGRGFNPGENREKNIRVLQGRRMGGSASRRDPASRQDAIHVVMNRFPRVQTLGFGS